MTIQEFNKQHPSAMLEYNIGFNPLTHKKQISGSYIKDNEKHKIEIDLREDLSSEFIDFLENKLLNTVHRSFL
ncbi:hypothetical protein [Adhaeribacter aquaticus]|uniref:hypothetical protein n=1 Tax=Adhaeribacter aquaticus TaxID=299567 RepID=UPI000402F599|nr:hypothetical protein [Adhaeribacter aquaticus]